VALDEDEPAFLLVGEPPCTEIDPVIALNASTSW